MGDFDNVMVTLRYPDGLLASIDVNRFASYGYDQRIEVFGDKGMIQAENRTPSSTVIADREGFTRPAIEYSFPTRYREAYRLELEAFLKCMREKATPPVTHHDVRMSFILCELGETATRENRPIRVDSHPAYQPAT
jgi:myo-inositol 2-dehydrogenase/D-chiro-inositol 1-dehydrogenase